MVEALFDNDNIRQFQPEFAKLVGVNVAIVAQQVHHWIKINESAQKNDHNFDGRWWTYNTYSGWVKDFPWWSKSTIERTFRQAREWGILICKPIYLGNEVINMWWTVDRQRCNAILVAGKKLQEPRTPRQIDATPPRQNEVRSHQIDVLTEITTKESVSFSLRYAVESESLPAYLQNIAPSKDYEPVRNADGEILPTFIPKHKTLRDAYKRVVKAGNGEANFNGAMNSLFAAWSRYAEWQQRGLSVAEMDAELAQDRKQAIAQNVANSAQAVERNNSKSELETAIRTAWGWDSQITDTNLKRVRKVVKELTAVGCLSEHIPLLHKHCIDNLTQFTVMAYLTQWDVWRSNGGKVLKLQFTAEQIEPTKPTANANDFVVVDDDGSWIGRGMEADKELQRRRAARAKGEVA